MKLLVDENVTRALVDEIEARGHDVLWIARTAPGLADRDIFRLAMRQRRIVLTFDKGHGHRAMVQPVPGVILVRFTQSRPILDATLLVNLLEGRQDWEGSLGVIHGHLVRLRALPDLSR